MSYHSAKTNSGQKYTGLSGAVTISSQEMIFSAIWLKNDTSGTEHTIAEVFNATGNEQRLTFRQLKAKGANNDRLLLEFRDGDQGTNSTVTDGAFTTWTFAAIGFYNYETTTPTDELRIRSYINGDAVQTVNDTGQPVSGSRTLASSSRAFRP